MVLYFSKILLMTSFVWVHINSLAASECRLVTGDPVGVDVVE
jgi:hypothetical protein